MVPGLDSTKEELQATAEYFLARGLATLAIDGPGQGESEYELPIEPAYEKVATAVVDYLQTARAWTRERIGLFGVSLGGYYAARAAAYEKRLAAVVSLAAPYRFDLDWDELPAADQGHLPGPLRRGARGEARAKAAELTLEEAARHISIPLLVVGGGRDRIAPAYHQERLAKEAQDAELRALPRRQPRRDQPRLRVPLPDGRLAGRAADRLDSAMPTHEVTNQPPPLTGYDASDDPALLSRPGRDGAGLRQSRSSRELGRLAGAAHAQEQGRLANENPPKLRTHDRYGHRIDEVEFHPAWHDLMTTAIGHGLHAAPWRDSGPARTWPARPGSTSGARPRPATSARSP